jgi:hypothetical protein
LGNAFFDRPILNTPYGYPARYWELNEDGQPTQDIIEKRRPAELLSVEPPPAMPFDGAGLSEMARSFYADNRRIDNQLIKSALGVTLAYPDYRAGLEAILAKRTDS